ncbi:MAG: hypothetical protein QOG25_2477 [Acetobacteraceae bacterium]|jgi:uncharacterized protein (DUF433 family)|nr:hypothetical protein [Acetobacteraceae bacterium]
MRLTVRHVIGAFAVYPNWDDPRRDYHDLEPNDIREALEFAASHGSLALHIPLSVITL